MTKLYGVAQRIDRVILTVPDLNAAERFYREALGFVRESRTDRLAACEADVFAAPAAAIASVMLRLGAQIIELVTFDPPGQPYPADSTSSDAWFQHCAIVVDDMAAAYARLSGLPIRPISRNGPETLPPNTGSVTAFKFRDPFGHPLELLQFSAEATPDAWRRSGRDGLFRGIDHTAIAVRDGANSRRFYEDRLGFGVKGHSRNAGVAQSALDAINDDQVEVVALSPRQEPLHLELLAYLTGARRARPADTGPADAVLTRTVIEVAGQPHRASTTSQMSDQVVADCDGHILILKTLVPPADPTA